VTVSPRRDASAFASRSRPSSNRTVVLMHHSMHEMTYVCQTHRPDPVITSGTAIWAYRSPRKGPDRIGSPHWTISATGCSWAGTPAKGHENRRLCRMAVLGAARSRLAMEQARPSNCLIRSVRD
jgi:hypothetical protein